jgi:adenylate kinase
MSPPHSRFEFVDYQGKYRAILLFGMPGSGKGTQGSVLGQLPDLVHISMGDVFRKIPRSGKLGAEIESYTSVGKMVPDELTVRIFERHVKILELQEFFLPGQQTLILDGLPRNRAQAEQLDAVIDVVQIFHLEIDDVKLAMKRLRARALRENRLDDMSEEVIKRRLNTYYDETFRTLSHYPPELIYKIDAGQAMIHVLRDIVDRLSDLRHDVEPA